MRPFEFLRRTPAEQIVTFLRNEAPQTIALVVANLHTTLAAQVLSHLPETEQADIALRIARMGETSPDVVKKVEEVMKQKLASIVQQDYSAAGGVKSLAEILNHADRPTERNVLDALTETDEELAAEVRRLLFVFEDIIKLDDRSIQLVLREADQKDLALALRGVSDEVRDRILQNMSERGAQMLLRGDGVPAAAAQARRRGGSGPDRGDRAHVSRRPAWWCCPAATPMSSSEPAVATAPPIAPYAFEQLDSPAHATSGGAADLLSAAWEEAERIRAQARLTGEAEGRAEGLAAAQRAGRTRARRARRGRRRLSSSCGRRLVAALEREAVELALRIAEQIIAGALEVEPERIVDIARGALRRRGGAPARHARRQPERSRAHVRRAGAAANRARRESSTSTCRPTGASTCGGAILRTRSGEIDAHHLDAAAAGPRDRRARPCGEGGEQPRCASTALRRASDAIQSSDLARRRGRVGDLIGLIIEAIGPRGGDRRGVPRRRGAPSGAGADRGRRLPRPAGRC